jgi:3'(2'), 5'-bisphosphate nucleotidase
VNSSTVDFATLNAWADRLIDTARAAGEAIMDVYRSDFTVSQKTDASPVTEADRAAERVVLADLAQLSPRFPIVAEEQVAAHGPPTFDGETFWLVDALDGTKDFVKKGDEFTVNIAFVSQGLPVLGIVFAPARGVLYAGVVNPAGTHRAEVWRAGARTTIRCRRRPAKVVVAGSKSHEMSENMRAFLARHDVAERIVMSSSLKFGLVAEGAVDLYPRFSPTSEWDTAAGHAVVRAAGGRMHDQAGVEVRYKKPDFVNGRFLVEGLPS